MVNRITGTILLQDIVLYLFEPEQEKSRRRVLSDCK